MMSAVLPASTVTWKPVCRRNDLVARSGVVALMEGHQIALILIPDTEAGDTIYAIDNHDPFSGANVIGRGLVGNLGGEPIITSPMYKQQFRLRDGQCLQDASVRLRTWPARLQDEIVEVAFKRSCPVSKSPSSPPSAVTDNDENSLASHATRAAPMPARPERRHFINTVVAGGVGLLTSSLAGRNAFATGLGTPEKTEVRIGFIPLTDCASVVMASVLGFDEKYGIKIIPGKEANWATVRDKLLNGENDMSHILYGELVGLQAGIGGPQTDMAQLMTLNRNGQGISLSRQLANAGATDLSSLVSLMKSQPREYVFAHTFPTGTHAMWLYYWLAAGGVNPMRDAKVITVPPPQMVANARIGNMDGFSVGEPWNHRGIIDGVSVHVASSQDIWPDHPEKILGTTAAFANQHPNTCKAVIAAILEASRWIDASAQNREKMADTIAARSYVNTNREAIIDRIQGRYQDGLGKTWEDHNHMKFHDDGNVNYPYLSDTTWFLTQHKRWGLLKEHPDYDALARKINRIDLYREAAAQAGVAIPDSDMRSSTFMDGKVWNGANPAAYADSFEVRA